MEKLWRFTGAGRKRSILGLTAFLCIVGYLWFSHGRVPERSILGYTGKVAPEKTLVMYAFPFNSEEHWENLLYFLKHGYSHQDGCDYHFRFSGDCDSKRARLLSWVASMFGRMPENIKVSVEGGCLEWGMFGSFLRDDNNDLEAYKYFIFMTSSLRGPFFPDYHKGHWSTAFTSRITGREKLVGTTISCEPNQAFGGKADTPPEPYVQSGVIATDPVGLEILRKQERVFDCFTNDQEATYYSLISASRGILRAGYNIACLLVRYDDVDFADKDNWNCSGGGSPTKGLYYDGMNVHPFEVVFHKFREDEGFIPFDGMVATRRYAEWRADDPSFRDIGTNRFDQVDQLILARELGVSANPRTKLACFDVEYYRKTNKLPKNLTAKEVYNKFITHGQFYDLKARFYEEC